MVDLATLLIGGAASRPDSITGLQPDFVSSLQAMLAAAPPDIQSALRINSAYRSPELQARLYQDAIAKYGSPEAARKWVAPPGGSQHGKGNAADLKFLSDAAREWAHANASQHNLAFPLSHEPWHIELASARDGGAPAHQHAHGAPPAAAGGASAMTAMAGGTAGMPAAGGLFAPSPGPDPSIGGLAALFMQNQAAQQQRRREEEEADAQARRAALFGGSLFG